MLGVREHAEAAHIAEPPPPAGAPMSPEPPIGAAALPMSEPEVGVVVVVAAFLWWQPASAAETKIATTIDIFFIALVLSLVLFSPLAPARQQKHVRDRLDGDYFPGAQGSAPPLDIGAAEPPAGVMVPP